MEQIRADLAANLAGLSSNSLAPYQPQSCNHAFGVQAGSGTPVYRFCWKCGLSEIDEAATARLQPPPEMTAADLGLPSMWDMRP